jgi:hypothetical protein
MGQKIKLDDKEYEVENLSDQAKAALASLQFTNTRIQEINNMQKLLLSAKNNYMESLKQEMLSSKSGLLFGDD